MATGFCWNKEDGTQSTSRLAVVEAWVEEETFGDTVGYYVRATTARAQYDGSIYETAQEAILNSNLSARMKADLVHGAERTYR